MGKRCHFWILILKSDEKNIPKSLFLDPISGNYWEVNSNHPFIKIDQVFNHNNIWINIRNEDPIDSLDLENF